MLYGCRTEHHWKQQNELHRKKAILQKQNENQASRSIRVVKIVLISCAFQNVGENPPNERQNTTNDHLTKMLQDLRPTVI